ncbi:hypothetical protein EB001_00050 [bacterium]|nr:hypothetical protein [bacterium]
MSNKRIHIPKLKAYYELHDIRCTHCQNKMLAGVQYYAMKTIWVEFSCVGCARGGDVELKEINAILKQFGFNPIRERYVVSK